MGNLQTFLSRYLVFVLVVLFGFQNTADTSGVLRGLDVERSASFPLPGETLEPITSIEYVARRLNGEGVIFDSMNRAGKEPTANRRLRPQSCAIN